MYFNALFPKVLEAFNDFYLFQMDDVLVHDSNEENHLKHLQMIFEKIREAGLKLKLLRFASLNANYNT